MQAVVAFYFVLREPQRFPIQAMWLSKLKKNKKLKKAVSQQISCSLLPDIQMNKGLKNLNFASPSYSSIGLVIVPGHLVKVGVCC